MRSHAKDASAPSTHRENATFSLGVFAAMLVGAVAFLGIGASAAGAATPGLSYGHTGEIGSADVPIVSSRFTNVIAVSNDGNVFIARQRDADGFGAFDVLDPATGNSLARPSSESLQPSGLAVSPDGAVVFMLGFPGGGGNSELRKFERTSTDPLLYAQDVLWSPATPLVGEAAGIAMDPATGDPLVAIGGVVKRFDSSSGALLSTIDGATSGGGGTFAGPQSLATAPNGDVYVADLSGRILHFAADGSFKGILLPGGGASGIAVNPQNSDVAVEFDTGSGATEVAIRIFSATNELKDVIRVPSSLAVPEGSKSNNKGLAFSPDGSRLYVGLVDGSAHVYSRATQPGVDAPTVSDVTPTGAHVSANVATAGDPTTAKIEYCLATDPCANFLTSEGASPWKVLTEEQGLSTDPGQDTIAGDLAGLTPNTAYVVRTFAVNETNQIENRSAAVPLSTAIPPPLVTTAAASDVSETSAQLVGSVDNTFGDQTTFHFEYGLTTDYGNRLPAGADGFAGNLRTPRTFIRLAAGLQPGTTYHYRLVATNSAGSSAGADRTFTTLTPGQLPSQRAYEQVTPVNKDGLSLQVGFGVQAAADGSGFEFATTSPSTDASSAAVVQRYVAWRGETDWIGQKPLDPPFHPARAVVVSPSLGASGDLHHALVVSQYKLTPEATEGAANLYVHDLDSDAYRFVGSSTEIGAFIGMVGTTRQDSFIAAGQDSSWFVFISRYRLLPGVPQVAMYKWTDTGGLSLISLLPGDAVPTGNVRPQSATQVANRLVSDDGDTVVFSLRDGDDGVYRRSNGQTEEVSVGQASGGPTGLQSAIADGLSSDGNFVFFHSSSQLTDGDIDGVISEYRYDASAEELEYLGPQDGTGDGMVDVPWTGRDGKTVYFNSENQLKVWREGRPELDVVSSSPVRGGSFGSPNGRYFEFTAPDGSVHLYDAEAGEASCISCAAGEVVSRGGLADAERNFSNRVPQVVTDDGHAYFNTGAALLNADRNGSTDVYEYFQGRLTLISPGNGDFNATLMDISADGRDVFFATAQGLVSRDTDQAYDIYDARVGGGFASQNPLPPSIPCAGDSCQGAAGSPPAPLTPGSAGTKGSGNTKPRKTHCPKNARKVRRNGKARCVKKGKHGSKKRDTKHNRGASR